LWIEWQLDVLFHYDPACPNVFVSRPVQTGLSEFGTLLAHIWPKDARVEAIEDPINLFGFIDLEWSHPPGSNRRPADYESAALPAELGWLPPVIITSYDDSSKLKLISRSSPLGSSQIVADRAGRAAKKIGLSVAGSIAILERGSQLKKVDDLRSVYRSLLEQGIRFDHKLLEESLRRLNLEAL
jgi:hypothetical protein